LTELTNLSSSGAALAYLSDQRRDKIAEN
jgi:hypothetical protein